MLIIADGPDGSGKSSLCRALVTRLNAGEGAVELLHRGPPTAHPLVEYAQPLYDYRPDQGRHLIIDRWHVGELVYPRILNRSTQLDEPTLRYIELLLMSRGAMIVHLTQPTSELRRRVQVRGDDLIHPEQLEDTRKLFEDVFRNIISTSSWRLDGVPTDANVDAIVDEARRAEMAAAALNPFRTYVGSDYADVLLFGDVRGPGNVDPNAPAFVPYPATSGHYLLRSLGLVQAASANQRAQHGWRRIGIANACDVDDPGELWEAMGKPNVVTLGRSAETACRGNGVPIARVALHPQFVRRFHYGDALAYGRYLMGHTEELSWR